MPDPRRRSPRRRWWAAALAAVGFAVSAAGSLRERGAEFAVLRALGAPRRQLARMIAAEQGVLVALALVVGTALGAVLTRAVIPLIVLTAQATRPVPRVLVELPVSRVALLLVAVSVTPLLVTAALALRRGDAVASLREQGVSEMADAKTGDAGDAGGRGDAEGSGVPVTAPWIRTRLRASPVPPGRWRCSWR